MVSGSTEVLWGAAVRSADLARDARRMRLVELQDTFMSPPRGKMLQRWREMVPDTTALTCRAWGLLTHGPGVAGSAAVLRDRSGDPLSGAIGQLQSSPLAAEAYRRSVEAAVALGCTALVFETPASFTPTQEHRRRVGEFFQQIERHPALDLVWEPHGMWVSREVVALCRDHGLVPSYDPLAEQPGPETDRLYIKLRGSYYSDHQLEQISEIAMENPETRVVFATTQAVRDAHRFQRWLEL